jgi:hypothetical protein
MNDNNISEAALESRARRAARRLGFSARKSTLHRDSVDNYGEFMIVDEHNCIVAGQRYDMTAEQVIAWCSDDEVTA